MRRLLEDVRRWQRLRRTIRSGVAVTCREKINRVPGKGSFVEHRHAVGGELSIKLFLALGINHNTSSLSLKRTQALPLAAQYPLRWEYLGIHSSSSMFFKRIEGGRSCRFGYAPAARYRDSRVFIRK